MEDGVWRTVGGRRIFIKDGESLSSAMKKSGKFGKKKQGEEKELKEKYINLSQEERVKAYEEGKNWKDLVKENKIEKMSIKNSEGKIEELDMNEVIKIEDAGNKYDIQMKDGSMSVSKDKVVAVNGKEKSNIRSQQKDIEEASGLKIEKAFQTDAYGTGKEDRFKLEDGRYVAHDLEDDTWSVNKVEGGKIKGQDFKNYNDMIKNLSRSEPYKEAFNEYKKKHPNSKITLNKFIDMSEGK